MAIVEWSTVYPAALDTNTQQPTVVNNVDDTRSSQILTLRSVIQSLESRIGSDLNEIGSLRKRVLDLESATISLPDTKSPRLTWTNISTVTVVAAPGEPTVVKKRFQDSIQRSFTGSLVFNFANGVAENGLDAGAEASNTWYYLYLVPKASDNTLIVLRASVNTPTTGPTGYTNFKYIGAFRNNNSSDIIKFFHSNNDEFRYSGRIEPANSATMSGLQNVGITVGFGDTISGVAPTMTLTDAAGIFTAAMVGRAITLFLGISNRNNGTFIIQSFISATQITYNNPNGLAESFAGGIWVVRDPSTPTHISLTDVVPQTASAAFVYHWMQRNSDTSGFFLIQNIYADGEIIPYSEAVGDEPRFTVTQMHTQIPLATAAKRLQYVSYRTGGTAIPVDQHVLCSGWVDEFLSA